MKLILKKALRILIVKIFFKNFLAQKSYDINSLPSFNSIKSIKIKNKNTSFEKININNSRKRLSLNNQIQLVEII